MAVERKTEELTNKVRKLVPSKIENEPSTIEEVIEPTDMRRVFLVCTVCKREMRYVVQIVNTQDVNEHLQFEKDFKRFHEHKQL